VEFGLKLSLRSEYALLALTHLARQDPLVYHSIQTIAQEQRIPLRFLEPIVLTLRQGGYLRAARGQRSGYRLAKPAKQISLAEIIRLIEDASESPSPGNRQVYESTPIEMEPLLMQVVREIRATVKTRLELTSIDDVTFPPGGRRPRYS
jgi:Rrf2 family protein